MGDAGPPSPSLDAADDGLLQREVTVLVTGFGPFKSFPLNPSHLIASRLPSILVPAITSDPKSASTPIIIHLIVHPIPIRVSYATVATLVPQLLATHDPDYVFHIGMAGGRDYYTLETVAHRDGYRIRDVDNMDGYLAGERRWRAERCPEVLEAGWDADEVLKRWKMGLAQGRDGSGSEEADARLSGDAGRFLCDFIFYESLSGRWKAGREGGIDGVERVGKVCFLHVPGETDPQSIERGVRVAESAIRSVVGCWEEGYRR